MTEMTRRARLMASALRQPADRLPFFHWWRHMQTGWAERECRARGMGISWLRPAHVERLHGVDIAEERRVVDGQTVVRRTFTTPVGSIYEDEVREPGTFLWHADRSWRDVTPWLSSHRIKGPEDYPVAKYIAEHTEYVADYFPIEQALDWLGDEGVVNASLPHSPWQTIAVKWVGSDEGRIFYHMVDYPELVDELYEALCRSREPLYEIAAKSPASIVHWGDNVDGQLVTPRTYERYLLPQYERQASYLRPLGKLFGVHMDGRMATLTDLIARSPIDIVEALHPPPMGDLPLDAALAAWPDKAIWLGFPGGIYELGPAATTEHALELLQAAGAGERLAIAMSTENIVSNENLLALTAVLERATLPLTPESVAEIARAVRR